MSLQLQHLRVEQLRQFRAPYELRDLTPGLNIFSGPNEAGKSTLVRAIRAAFFQRYRSKVVDDLRPRDDGSATPSVELEFTLNQQKGRLFKSFLGSRARCSLSLDGQQWDGGEAEDQLASLLGFAYAAKGASRAEHWGIPGLLWVEQGTGQDLADAALHAQDHIHAALQERISQASAGTLAASGGDALLASFEAQLGELQTPTGRPKAGYQTAIETVSKLQTELRDLEERIGNYQRQVDELASLRTQHEQDEAQRPWEILQIQLDNARQREQALAQGAMQLNEARQRLEHLVQQRDLLLAQLRQHEQREQALRQARSQADEAIIAFDHAREAVNRARHQATAAELDATQARQVLALARQEANRAQWQAQLHAATEAHSRHKQALLAAQACQTQMEALQAQAAACAIQPTQVKELEQLERHSQDLALQRQAVSTRLQFSLHDGQTLQLQGPAGAAAESLSGQGDRLLAEAVRLSLPGLGELTITPGGQDLAALRGQCDAAQATLIQQLQSLGLADVDQARQRLSQHEALLTHIKIADNTLRLSAPQGLAPLQVQIAQAQGHIQACQAALAQLPPGPDEPNGAEPPVVLSLAEAEQAEQGARTQAEQAQAAVAQAQQAEARAEAEQQAHARQALALSEQLTEAEHLAPLDQARQQVARLADEVLIKTASVSTLERQQQEVRPEIVQQDVLRLTRSIEQQRQAHQQRLATIQHLTGQLQQAGATGMEEQHQARRGALDLARQRMAELERRAKALSLLCTKLQTRRQAAMDQLREPLQKHLQRYLQLLFPNSQVKVGDQLTPELLERRTATGSTEQGDVLSLSFGAREQLGVISRFAYADLLAESGRPTLLILDDALVHSDADRLAQMKRVIFDASQRHQILLFTCHAESWRDLGVAVRRVNVAL